MADNVQAMQEPQKLQEWSERALSYQKMTELRERLVKSWRDGTLAKTLVDLETDEEIAVAQDVLDTEATCELTLSELNGFTTEYFETPTAFGRKLDDVAVIFFSKTVELDVNKGVVESLQMDRDAEMLTRMNLPFLQRDDFRESFWWVKMVDIESASKPWLLQHCDPESAEYVLLTVSVPIEEVKVAGVHARERQQRSLVLIPTDCFQLEYCPEIDGDCTIENVQKERAAFYINKHQEKLNRERLTREANRSTMQKALQERAQTLPALKALEERLQRLSFEDLQCASTQHLGGLEIDFSDLYHLNFGPLRGVDYTKDTVEKITRMVDKAEEDISIYQRRQELYARVMAVARSMPVWVENDMGEPKPEVTTCRKDITGIFRLKIRLSFERDQLYIYSGENTIFRQINYDESWSEEAVRDVMRNCYRKNRNALARWIDWTFLKVRI